MKAASFRSTALAATVVLAGFDAGSFGPALPLLREGLSLDDPRAAWLITAYVLGTLLGNPLHAWNASRTAPGRALGATLATFTLGAAVVAVAPVFPVAFLGRLLQGVGAGAFLPLCTVAVARTTDPSSRGRAVMTLSLSYGVAFLVAAAGAPTLAAWRWRALYALLATLGAVLTAAVPGAIALPRADVPTAPLDRRGLALWAASLATLAVAIQRAKAGGASGALAPALSLVVGAALLATLWRVERAHPSPLLPVALARHGTVRAVSVLALAAGCAQVFAVTLPTWAHVVVGVAAKRVGVWSLPFVLAGLVGTGLAATVIDRLGARRVVMVTGALTVAGGAAVALGGASGAAFAMGSAVLGAGVCTLAGGPLRHLLTDLDAREMAPAQSLLAMVTNVGLLAGSALTGALASTAGDTAARALGLERATVAITAATAALLVAGLAMQGGAARGSPRG